MSAPKPYETRPDDLLIESPELPGLFWNMRTGLVCNKDGKLLTISPSAGLTNDPQAGYVAEQREPMLSNEQAAKIASGPHGFIDMCKAIDFYEAKITSG